MNSAKNETRYMVTSVNWEEKKRIARNCGWDGRDDSLVADYAEPEDGEIQFGPFASLRKAFIRAKQALEADSYGQTNIYLEQRDPRAPAIWDAVCVWYVCHDTKRVKQDSPDHRYETEAD